MSASLYEFGTITVLMFAATVGFLWYYRGRSGSSGYYYVPPTITGVAGLAYAVMTAAAAGLLDPSVIVPARYADWLVTTPLIVYYLTLVADAAPWARTAAPALDAVMIAVGYVATTATGAVRWGAFVVSSLAFLALTYVLVTEITAAADELPPAGKSLFLSLRNLTVFIYAVFPVVWLLSPYGFGVLALADHFYLIGLLDVLAKVGFDVVIAVRTSAVRQILDRAGQQGGVGA